VTACAKEERRHRPQAVHRHVDRLDREDAAHRQENHGLDARSKDIDYSAPDKAQRSV
jgi:hypothetical protein